jgi:hypothetical protein
MVGAMVIRVILKKLPRAEFCVVVLLIDIIVVLAKQGGVEQ